MLQFLEKFMRDVDKIQSRSRPYGQTAKKSRGENCHAVSGGPAPLQILPDIGLQGYAAVGVLGQLHPLRYDLLTALLQIIKCTNV